MSARVYRYGCRAPSSVLVAEQLLGQASNYREDLRRAYNDATRDRRAYASGLAESEHVRAYEQTESASEEIGHVYEFDRARARSELDARRNADIRRARSGRGHLLDAGTYWLVEASMLQAAKMSKGDVIARKRWDGTGRIGAAIQSTKQFSASAWTHPRVQLTEPDSGGYALLTIVVGDLKDNRAITWPIKLHRAMPADGIVKQVAVQRIRVGHRYRWEALITVEASHERLDEQAMGTVGIDIGWRREGALGQRVATHDAIDDCDALRIDTLDAFRYSDDVRGTRDRCFDEAKEYAKRSGIVGAEHANYWRDRSRLHRLAGRANDLGLAWWVEVDKHLEDIECAVRAKAQRRRLDSYRRYADALAKRYRTVAIEDMPMQDWVGEGQTSARERGRSTANLHTLQLVLADRFGPGRVDWVPCAYSTMTCAACGIVRADRVGQASHWTCSCGVEHHQDVNAAHVLRLDSERWCGDGNPPRDRKRKALKKMSKKERKVNERAAVLVDNGTARGSPSMAA